MATLITGPIENTAPSIPVNAPRPSVQFRVLAENVGASEQTIQIEGYYLSDLQTPYVLELNSIAPSGQPGSVYRKTYYSNFDGFEFRFITSSSDVAVSAWGIDATGKLVTPHRLVTNELTSLT